MTTEVALWNRWLRNHDETAFGRLVAPHLRFLHDYARRLGCGPSDVDEVVQSALCELLRRQDDKPCRGRPALAGDSATLFEGAEFSCHDSKLARNWYPGSWWFRRTKMLRHWLLPLLAIASLSMAGPPPEDLPAKKIPRSMGVLVLDNCDSQYKDKLAYGDKFTLLDSEGKQKFRVSDFNNCESIGSSRMIAADPARKCIWVIENVAHRIRRFDYSGRETLRINEAHGSAIAVDPQTGNVWALANEGKIGGGTTVVYDSKGKVAATYAVTGWDIAYDKKAGAFWIVDKKLTKITAAKGKVVFSIPICAWCASSIDVNPKTGTAWVAVRRHPQVEGSSNRLIKFGADGNELVSIDLGAKSASRVSVDGADGSVWASLSRSTVQRFSAKGVSKASFAFAALAVQADAASGGAWVVTRTDVLKLSPDGKVTTRAKHAGKTSQAWIASLE